VYTRKKEVKREQEAVAASGARSVGAQPPAQGNPTPQPPSPAQQRSLQRQSYGFPDSDPWGTPELHRGHSHTSTNGTRPTSKPAPAAMPERTTSAFTTTSQSASDLPTSPPTQESAGAGRLWGGYNRESGSSFRDSGIGGGFGEGAGGEGDGGNDPTGLGAPLPRILPSGPEEVITVTSLPEKEGMFMFQHRNYQVTSARRNSKVIRRYSDFAWLLDCLHKRYPFRQLPLLPPKRVASKS
jgi:sorting nexin-8